MSVSRSFGMRSPTSGMRSAALLTTLTWPGAATVFAPSLVTARIEYLPGFLNGTWAAYTAANGSASVAACLER